MTENRSLESFLIQRLIKIFLLTDTTCRSRPSRLTRTCLWWCTITIDTRWWTDSYSRKRWMNAQEKEVFICSPWLQRLPVHPVWHEHVCGDVQLPLIHDGEQIALIGTIEWISKGRRNHLFTLITKTSCPSRLTSTCLWSSAVAIGTWCITDRYQSCIDEYSIVSVKIYLGCKDFHSNLFDKYRSVGRCSCHWHMQMYKSLINQIQHNLEKYSTDTYVDYKDCHSILFDTYMFVAPYNSHWHNLVNKSLLIRDQM